MKFFNLSLIRLALVSAVTTACLPVLRAQDVSQAVDLAAGWNSVWLEVEPRYAVGDTLNADPSGAGAPVTLVAGDSRIGQPKAPWDIFSDPAVLIVATPQPRAGLAEFFSAEPGQIESFNEDQWQQWKRTDPAGSNNLVMTLGNRPYLIQTSSAKSFAVSGKARFFRPTWTPDRYNLIGFGLEDAPSFSDFFSPSGATHPVDKIFKLDAATGNWQRVGASDAMKSDEAYWIFCSGPSRYMGPVAVGFERDLTGALNFSGPSDAVKIGRGVSEEERDLEELTFSNLGTAPATPVLDLIARSGAGLGLRAVTPATQRIGYDLGNVIDTTPGIGGTSALGEEVAPGSNATLTLGASRNWVIGMVGRTNVYRLKTGDGAASVWLPVSALNSSLSTPNTQIPEGVSSMDGLWVGEIIIDSSSSIVEDGSPVRPTAGSAPMRVILHSSGSGSVLLSQVTVMQTKTADPDVSPTPVLVIDPARIPFFEGVKERNGKKVGVRIEAVAYDMPRKLDAASQAALLDDPAYPSLNEAGIADFLLARNGRPPSLAETYHSSWPMSGPVGPGETLTTTFTLDPFHRTNPFRHAFHREQARGTAIKRTMTITFDSEQGVNDTLRGTFNETIQGLIQSNIKASGRVQFRRVSTVATLEGAQ